MDYETSLWDLKPMKTMNIQSIWTLWDIPMGFETRQSNRFKLHDRLWDIPMGFETGRGLRAFRDWNIMRHPYGIWNSYLMCCYTIIKQLWDIPMGFETFHRPYLYISCDYYETSLWDLKLKRGDDRCLDWKLWDIPMGFETKRFPVGFLDGRGLWDIPMGFETSGS